ncbi:hypothetical protein NC652_001705 [Populus alba x Populus x berolinensis]|uniref:Uncharacterized protein n=1 Tax=Populus alba x Populus x berolinensis TaxID=444605 RepID=A0AAD6RMV9_9ROSI|nr:hypothetical protein NC652_001701 [Populus alba x Populus x berolinensis]KAJ6963161.1 hypothetical protein NC652_001705 [Populus alba x Populus x berolinensis]KAJ7011396.1 hypothetical protein NC653_001735 [Populus alba x Populus x berolinensis]
MSLFVLHYCGLHIFLDIIYVYAFSGVKAMVFAEFLK